MKRILFALCLLAVPATAQATNLPVGTTGTGVAPDSVTASYPGGTILAAVNVNLAPAGANWTATVREVVVRESGGSIDFLYQVTNTSSPGADSLERITLANFAGFTTNVSTANSLSSNVFGTAFSGVGTSTGYGFVNGGTQNAPDGVNRPTADNVGWNYFNTPIAPGQSSLVLIVKTNATTFGSGSISLIDTVTSTTFNGFSPNPEPGTIILLAGCLGGMGLNIGLRRFRKTTEPAVG
jgi:hypothetical protein